MGTTRRTGRAIRAALEPLEARWLLAVRVADLNDATLTTGLSAFASSGDGAYFFSSHPTRGLWETDGTAAGTRLVKSFPASTTTLHNLCDADGTLFFVLKTSAGTVNERHELWMSDGTAAGTTLVPGMPTATFSTDGLFDAGSGRVYFAADTNPLYDEPELWTSDGTAAGTHLVKKINPQGGSYPYSFKVYDGLLYFGAEDGQHGYEVWRTDGTDAGTVRVTDLNPGVGTSWPNDFVVSSGALYFKATTTGDSDEDQVFRYDAATGTTTAITPLHAVRSIGYLSALDNGDILFGATDLAIDEELFKTNGTPGNISLVKDMDPTFGGRPIGLTPVNGRVVFRSFGETVNGVWTSDGTEAGTFQLLDENTARYSGSDFYAAGGKLYFGANDAAHGNELWVTDGTVAGTHLVSDLNPGTAFGLRSGMAALPDGRLLFSADNGIVGGEPFVTDGTAGGTSLLLDMNTATDDAAPDNLLAIGSTLYFTATTATTGTELFRTSPGASGITLVRDIMPGTGSGTPLMLTDVAGTLYFVASDTANASAKLFRTDGTAPGTTAVAGGLSNFSNLLAVGSSLYFLALDPAISTTQYGIYRLDTAVTGATPTRMVALPAGSPNVSSLANMIQYNGALYFRYQTTANGTELYRSDLTPAGTGLLKQINSSFNSANPDRFTLFNNQLFFTATGTGMGHELWRTDGTEAGTVMVKDINAGSVNSTPSYLTVYNGALYFSATTAAGGAELWRSDGTTAGTVQIKDINPGTGSSTPRNLMVVSGLLMLEASDVGTNSNELWRSDGTAAGTVLVRRIGAINAGSNPQQFAAVNGRLFFRAGAAVTKTNLWTSDGTFEGTHLVDDQMYTVRNLLAVGGTLFYSGFDAAHGHELWAQDADSVFTTREGRLIITGTGGDDTIGVARNGDDIAVTVNGFTTQVPATGVTSVVVSSMDGNDTVTSDDVSLSYSARAGVDAIHVNSGAASLDGTLADAAVRVAAGASISLTPRQRIGSLAVFGSAAVPQGAGGSAGPGAVIVNFLEIGLTGRLDLAKNALVIDYVAPADSPVGTWSGAAYSGITGLIDAGRNGGTWDGVGGIVTSMPAAMTGLTTLAPAEAADVLGLTGGQTALWGGVTVDATAILVKYTYAGDANLDGIISGDDYAAIDFNIAVTDASAWYNGDFNFDGIISGDDYAAIDFNIAAQGPPL